MADSATMRALAYCAFRDDDGITFPATGVNSAAIQEVAHGGLRVLWSEVEWPFAPAQMQRNAVEFHEVVSQVFARAAVAPFPLLTVFHDRPALEAFVAARAHRIAADLERLRDLVQVECVLYVVGRDAGTEALHNIGRSVADVQHALTAISPEVRVREVRQGRRIFALVRRGRDEEFRSIVEAVALPERISRRTRGPRPASEFLSETLKAPGIAGS